MPVIHIEALAVGWPLNNFSETSGDKPIIVSAILLAAGKAARMGQPKLLMPFGSSTVLERTLDNLLNSRVDEIILVLGNEAQQMKRIAASRAVKVVFNPDYSRGISTSLIAGLKQVNSQAQKVMLALADQPLIDKDTYDRLIEISLGSDKGIIVPTYQNKRGNPVILSIKYKEELLKLEGDVGGREIIKKHRNDVLAVAVDSESINIDIDTLDDYYSCLRSARKERGRHHAQESQTE